MVSGLLSMFRKTKRAAALRDRPYRLLRSMIEGACLLGPTLEIVHIGLDGTEIEHRFVVEEGPYVDANDLWDLAFFNTFVTMYWSADVNDPSVPWISSPGMRPHLADWVAFILDLPQTDRIRKIFREVTEAKKNYMPAALGILSQLAAAFNLGISEITGTLEQNKFDKGRGGF